MQNQNCITPSRFSRTPEFPGRQLYINASRFSRFYGYITSSRFSRIVDNLAKTVRNEIVGETYSNFSALLSFLVQTRFSLPPAQSRFSRFCRAAA